MSWVTVAVSVGGLLGTGSGPAPRTMSRNCVNCGAALEPGIRCSYCKTLIDGVFTGLLSSESGSRWSPSRAEPESSRSRSDSTASNILLGFAAGLAAESSSDSSSRSDDSSSFSSGGGGDFTGGGALGEF